MNKEIENQIGQPPKSIVDFDKKCLSCSDQPSKVISAFKMACLTYKPGNIVFNHEELSRSALINIGDQ